LFSYFSLRLAFVLNAAFQVVVILSIFVSSYLILAFIKRQTSVFRPVEVAFQDEWIAVFAVSRSTGWKHVELQSGAKNTDATDEGMWR
jgi:hypothetical protein